MKILEEEFTGAIQKFCEVVHGKKKNEKCHYYGHFNILIATIVGTSNIKEETLFNTKEYEVATAVKRDIIELIHHHIDMQTDKEKAYTLIKEEALTRANTRVKT